MIVFFEYGRSGSQLFQYYGFRNYFPNHKLLFFGCSSLRKTFENINVAFVKLNKNSILYRLIKKLLFFLSDIRVLSKIIETNLNKKLKNEYLKINENN
ncbi:hypothetical protein OAQ67_01200 [Candidatus Pelagibacter ubique]|nr:hypothetical protein [Candidatus Pelagibacter ubique]